MERPVESTGGQSDAPEVTNPTIALPDVEIVTGAWQTSLADALGRLGVSRAAVVCGRGAGGSLRLREQLGDVPLADVRMWESVETHAPVASVEHLADEIGDWAPNVLVSVGGGSSHDTVKGVAALMASGGRLLDRCLVYRPPAAPEMPELLGRPIPIITIPTTYAGSEANGAAGFSAQGRKRVVAARGLAPRAVLVDGAALATTPREIIWGSAMNAINHCVEGLASRRRHIVSEALLGKALQELAAASGDLGPTRPDVLVRASVASAAAGIGLTGSWLGLAHALGHVIGAHYQVPHGWCHAVLAGSVVRFNAEARPAGHILAASLLGVGSSSDALADWLDGLADRWQLPRRLKDLGVPLGDISQLAEDAWRDHDTFYNPRTVKGPEDLVGFLETVY